MDAIAEYLLSVTAAGMLCAVVRNILGEKHISGRIIKAVSGVFMAITIFSPLMDFRLSDMEDYFKDFQYSAEDAADSGTQMAVTAMADIIKQQTESYILDKAASLGADVRIEVKMSDTNPPVPKEVILSGSISPYHKSLISQYISANFSIPEENQKWI